VIDTILTPGGAATTAAVGMSIAPNPLDFGKVPRGQHADLALTVSNTGTGRLIIEAAAPPPGGISAPKAPFEILDQSLLGAVIAPGAHTSVAVRFTAPDQIAVYTDSIIIRSNAGEHTLALHGVSQL
jgi:hypothetical protein